MKSLVTKHSRIRIHERTNYSGRLTTLAKLVSKNGLTKNAFKGDFRKYLKTKEDGKVLVKVYQGNIYILTKNRRRIITTYQIPKRYLPIEKYKLSDTDINIVNRLLSKIHRHVIITLKDNTIIKGIVNAYNASNDSGTANIIVNDEK